MTVSVEILDPRSAPEPEGWVNFRQRQRLQPVWDYELLRLEAWLARNPPVLAVVRDGTRLVGALSVMVCRSWREQAFAPAPSGRTRRLRPQWAEVYLPLLSGYPACVFAASLENADRREALRLFERELQRYLGFGLLGVIYRAMTAELVPAIDGPYRMSREIDPTAVLTNSFSSVEAWIGILAPGVRESLGEAAADLDTSAGAGRRDLDAHELAVLLNEHRARQDRRAWSAGQRARAGGLHMDTRSPIPPVYLDAFVRRPDVITRTYRDRHGKLLAFNTMIDHPDSPAIHHWAALPGAAGGRRNLYVDCYAHCVRYMIERGLPELTAGRALLGNKTALGFGTRALSSVAVPKPVLGR
jgi:hypothetical protein